MRTPILVVLGQLIAADVPAGDFETDGEAEAAAVLVRDDGFYRVRVERVEAWGEPAEAEA